jgi:NADPH:quinone reductase-like Zn-dependent oxidoreductase
MTRSVQFSEFGGTDVVKVVDTLPLTAGPGQVRLEMRAAGIKPVDWKTMQGHMREVIPLTLPAGLGSDVAGVVSEVGARCHSDPDG